MQHQMQLRKYFGRPYPWPSINSKLVVVVPIIFFIGHSHMDRHNQANEQTTQHKTNQPTTTNRRSHNDGRRSWADQNISTTHTFTLYAQIINYTANY